MTELGLLDFKEAILNLFTTDTPFAASLDGVALVLTATQVYYSASVTPAVGYGDVPPSINYLNQLFASLPIAGYEFSQACVFLFPPGALVSSPLWRLQLLYIRRD